MQWTKLYPPVRIVACDKLFCVSTAEHSLCWNVSKPCILHVLAGFIHKLHTVAVFYSAMFIVTMNLLCYAGQRAVAAPGRPLSVVIRPLLRRQLESLISMLSSTFPFLANTSSQATQAQCTCESSLLVFTIYLAAEIFYTFLSIVCVAYSSRGCDSDEPFVSILSSLAVGYNIQPAQYEHFIY